jgi:hypothetical protein
MTHVSAPPSDVFTATEIARAAGVSTRLVRELIRGGAIETLPGGFADTDAAVAAVRLLVGEPGSARAELFTPLREAVVRRSAPLAASAAAHGGLFVDRESITWCNYSF